VSENRCSPNAAQPAVTMCRTKSSAAPRVLATTTISVAGVKRRTNSSAVASRAAEEASMRRVRTVHSRYACDVVGKKDFSCVGRSLGSDGLPRAVKSGEAAGAKTAGGVVSRAEPGKSASIGEDSNASRSGSQPHRTVLRIRHECPSLPPAHGLFFLLRGDSHGIHLASASVSSRLRFLQTSCGKYRQRNRSLMD
jgi:hypothetical protein